MNLVQPKLPILLGGAKELGIVYMNIIRGAKEPRNLQNHRGEKTLHTCLVSGSAPMRRP